MSRIFFGFFVLVLGFLPGCPSPTPSGQTVPNVVGLARAAAESMLADAGLDMGAVTSQPSNSVPEGHVISQTPAAGATVSPGTAVSLQISSGPGLITLPQLVGLPRAEAETIIATASLILGAISEAYSETVPLGRVISQSPNAGSQVASGSNVNLVISLGPERVLVPHVTGLRQAAAEAAIAAAGLTLGTVGQGNSNTVQIGLVISQAPLAETPLKPGQPVSIIVSMGALVPNVTGHPEAQAQAMLQQSGLVLGARSEAPSATVPAGHVLTQAPQAGSSVDVGGSISLTISLGDCTFLGSVLGLVTSGAAAALEQQGMELGGVQEVFDDTVPTGRIISQSPAVGTCQAAGTKVDVTVSLGAGIIEINNLAELRKIGNDSAYPLDGNYALANDINAAPTQSQRFDPIGDADNPFVGRFDGKGHSIVGLNISKNGEYVGLFARLGVEDSATEEARVTNLRIQDCLVGGIDHVGALTGHAANGVLTNCSVEGQVFGSSLLGMVAGEITMPTRDCSATGTVSAVEGLSGGFTGRVSASMQRCQANVDVASLSGSAGGFAGEVAGDLTDCSAGGSATGWGAGGFAAHVDGPQSGNIILRRCRSTGDVQGTSVGGFAGNASDADFIQCFATGDVSERASGSLSAGGFIGYCFGGALVEQCFATGDVAAPQSSEAGGLIGLFSDGAVVDSYAHGDVAGEEFVGGLIGHGTLRGTGNVILRCYAAGSVTAPSTAERGALIGRFFASQGLGGVTDSFWNMDTSNLDISDGGTGITSLQMQQPATFTAAGWNFQTIWDIETGVGFPFLRYQE